tara:strand:+ start:2380 stop:3066 length:687 start_codon:yes stop_codon:yes gene_type:complete
MNGGEIFGIFRSFADESDDTFLTDANATSYLNQGYMEFRDIVSGIDPSIFQLDYNFTLTSREFDLANTTAPALPIMGNAVAPAPVVAAGTRLNRILRLGRVDSSSQVIEYLDGAPNELVMGDYAYTLAGTKLRFFNFRSGDFRLEYVPFPDMTGVFASGSTSYVDDLESFHMMIPLLALRYYAIRDGGTSLEVERQLAQIRQGLVRYLEEGRNEDTRYVLVGDWNTYG